MGGDSLFWNYAYVDPGGTTIVDGGAMFDAIYSLKKPLYVTDDGNINVFGVVFIKKQMEMHVYGRTYTGLGGGGQTVIWKSWERYYRPDGVTPKDGISGVQLHETMHAIGFHHSWQHEHYSSDFSWGPMGYFAFHNGTSTFDKNWVQGTYLDQMEALLWEELLEEQADLGGSERPETYHAEQAAIDAFGRARAYYYEMNWLDAYEALAGAGDWIKRLMWSTHDDTPPEINAWATIPSDFGSVAFEYIASVSDDLSGLENVTVYAQVDEGEIYTFPMSYGTGQWSASIPYLSHSSNLTLWVVAYDWGMNMAEAGFLTDLISESTTTITTPTTTPTSQPTPNLIIPLTIGISVAAVVIVVGVFCLKRQK
jgi:hypothetical protein